MKIKGWDKINGFTYKGYCIVNPIHNAPETRYMADVLDLNLEHKPKWELNVLTPKHKFIAGEEFIISLWDDNRLNTRKAVSKEMISDVSKFRILVEEMIDNLLKHRLIAAPTASTSSMYYTNSNGGILSTINNTGTTIPYSQIVQSIQSVQQTIANLNNGI